MVVFDMRDILSLQSLGDTLGFLKHWVDSIALHAPAAPMFLIGTFKDEVKDMTEFERIDERLREGLSLGRFKSFLQENLDDSLIFWPVDNKRAGSSNPDPTIVRLRKTIEEVVLKEEYIRRPIPVAWSRLIDLLMATKRDHMKLEEVRAIAAGKCGIQKGEQVEAALDLFHELGLLLHFRETEDLRQVVVLNPQWLINSLSLVIRDFKLHPMRET